MGAGASTNVDPRYVMPVERQDENGCRRTLFLATPLNNNVKAKATQVLLEVGARGFRLLRLGTEVPLFDFPFAHIHSWGHLPNKFSFKFFEDKSKAIILYTFETQLVDQLLEVIHDTIENILTDRKMKSVSTDEFAKLLTEIASMPKEKRLGHVGTITGTTFFTSQQAECLVAGMDSTFDKVEAACLLHFALVDQNHFSAVLRSLDCAADRENVLHRVTTEKQRRNQHKTNTRSFNENPMADPNIPTPAEWA